MKIEDNFLEQKKFNELQTLMMGTKLDWHYNDSIDSKNDKNKFQFFHYFYLVAAPCSPNFNDIKPIFDKMKPISLARVKANLLTKTPNIVENEFHVDMDFMSKKQQNQWTTSIFYINTNNGYTKFEDGTKVESVANRMITFPADMNHTGASCRDEKTRVVINFNYFSDREL